MKDRSNLLTEQRLDESRELDAMSVEDAVSLMHAQDLRAVEAVGKVKAGMPEPSSRGLSFTSTSSTTPSRSNMLAKSAPPARAKAASMIGVFSNTKALHSMGRLEAER